MSLTDLRCKVDMLHEENKKLKAYKFMFEMLPKFIQKLLYALYKRKIKRKEK